MFKSEVAIGFGALAVLCVVMTGIIGEARASTIAWRSLIAFGVAGTFSYLLAAWFEYKAITDETTEESEKTETPPQTATDQAKKNEPLQASAAKPEQTENKQEGEGEFKPLADENLEHVQTT